IDQQRRPSLSPQYFVKTNDATLARNQFVPRLLAQFFENWIEQRVFEFLRDDRPAQSRVPTGQTEPFEIAIVITSRDEVALAHVIDLFQVFKLDVIAEIFAR